MTETQGTIVLIIRPVFWEVRNLTFFFTFYLILSKENNNGLLYDFDLTHFFSRLFLIRAFPDDYDTCLFLHIFLLGATVLSAFSLAFAPLFFDVRCCVAAPYLTFPTLDACAVSTA